MKLMLRACAAVAVALLAAVLALAEKRSRADIERMLATY